MRPEATATSSESLIGTHIVIIAARIQDAPKSSHASLEDNRYFLYGKLQQFHVSDSLRQHIASSECGLPHPLLVWLVYSSMCSFPRGTERQLSGCVHLTPGLIPPLEIGDVTLW